MQRTPPQPSHSRSAEQLSVPAATDVETAHPGENQKHLLHPSKSQLPLALIQARLSRGWTQQHLADLIGATTQTVSRWERGVATPGLYHRNKLCALFGLSLAELGCSFASEASTENEADTTGGNEAGQAPGESNTEIGSETGHVFVVEREPAPSQAPLPLSAPIGLKEAANNVSQQTPLRASPTRPARHRRHTLLWRIVACSCVGILLASVFALIALYWPWTASLSSTARPTARPPSVSTGTVAFLSSGDVEGNSAQGMNDEIAIHLTGVPVAAPGMSYCVWMAGEASSEAVWTPLGRLTWEPTLGPDSAVHPDKRPNIGTASLFFVSPQHANLLLTFNRLLVTVEATNIPPQQPSSAWLYEASISAIPTPGDPHHYSLLDHLRHLLAADPSLAALSIKGGLIFWLTRNTQQVALEASGLEMDWHTHRLSKLRQRLLRILEYLDGNTLVKADLPPDAPRFSPSPFARVGLLTLSADQEPPGYVLHTAVHLQGVRGALGASPSQRQLAGQLRGAMNMVGFWLANVRQDALHLVGMDDAQLAQPSTLPLLRGLAAQAQDAYAGSPLGQSGQAIAALVPSPSATTPTETLAGVRWIAAESQQLATFSWYPA